MLKYITIKQHIKNTKRLFFEGGRSIIRGLSLFAGGGGPSNLTSAKSEGCFYNVCATPAYCWDLLLAVLILLPNIQSISQFFAAVFLLCSSQNLAFLVLSVNKEIKTPIYFSGPPTKIQHISNEMYVETNFSTHVCTHWRHIYI